MKNSAKFLIVMLSGVVVMLLALNSQAGLLYPYHRLALKDLDQMNRLIKEKIKEAKASKGEKSIPLKEALQAVYSRPNDDFLIEKIVSPLKNALDERGQWESTIEALVKEALGALKNPKAFKAEAQVTYALFLENLMSEFKPKIKEEFEKKLFQQIAEADIELSEQAKRERKLRLMKGVLSPSEVATHLLKELKDEK